MKMETGLIFLNAMNELQREIHKNAVEKGFYGKDGGEKLSNYEIIEKLLLIHQEVSEAVEALRTGNPQDKYVPSRSSFEVEIADVVIRSMDLAEAIGFSLAGAIVDKILANRTRPHKHGKHF